MFLNTFMCVHSAWLWNTMPVGRRSGGRWMTSSPSMVMLPAVGRSKPPTMRRSVDLPEPEGPSRQTSSPSPTVRSKVFDGTHLAEPLGDAFDFENRHCLAAEPPRE